MSATASDRYGLNEIGYTTLVICVFFLVLCIIAVALRLWTRIIIKVLLGIDDWLIAASGFIYAGFCANILVGVFTIGGGQTYADPSVEKQKTVRYMQSEYAIYALYGLNITAVKLSILFLYLRIFGSVDYFRKAAYTIMAICLLWFVIIITGNVLYCRPVQRFWDHTVEGSCFDFATFFLVMELADMVIDAAIIGLPMKTILGLCLSLRKRLGLLGIFVLGALVIVTNAIRIGYVYKPNHQLLQLSQASLWSVINLGISILCACLPTYFPLFGRARSAGNTFESDRAGNICVDDCEPKLNTGNSKGMVVSGYYYQMDEDTRDDIVLTQISADG